METGTLRHPRGGLYFEDFSVGQVFRHRLTRTVTQMDNMLFSNMTLNPQPLHIDAHFCATETEWGRPLMNSLFTLGLMIGISVNDTTVGTTIANLGMTDVAFPAPLFEGDTVRAETEVIGRARLEVARRGRAGRVPAPGVQAGRNAGRRVPPHRLHAPPRTRDPLRLRRRCARFSSLRRTRNGSPRRWRAAPTRSSSISPAPRPAKGRRRGPWRHGFLKQARARQRRPGARRRGQRARFRRNRRRPRRGHGLMRPTPSCCPGASGRRASSSSRPSLRCGRRISTSPTARRKSSPSSTRRGRCSAWRAIASRAGGSRASPGAPRRLRADIGAETDRDHPAPTPAPFAWRATLRSWPRPPRAWRRSTPRSPTSPTSKACARKRSPPGATAFQRKLAISPEQAGVVNEVFRSRPVPPAEPNLLATDRSGGE